MNTQIILEYLADLSQNNDREWYHAHKERYKQANAEFELLIGGLIAALLFRHMKPFNDYLNTALKGFTIPKR